jgi:hypothetical protein
MECAHRLGLKAGRVFYYTVVNRVEWVTPRLAIRKQSGWDVGAGLTSMKQ